MFTFAMDTTARDPHIMWRQVQSEIIHECITNVDDTHEYYERKTSLTDICQSADGNAVVGGPGVNDDVSLEEEEAE